MRFDQPTVSIKPGENILPQLFLGPPSPEALVGRIRRDPIDPAPQGGFSLERGDLSHRVPEGVLTRLFGVLRIPGDLQGKLIHPRPILRHERLHRRVVTVAKLADQLRIRTEIEPSTCFQRCSSISKWPDWSVFEQRDQVPLEFHDAFFEDLVVFFHLREQNPPFHPRDEERRHRSRIGGGIDLPLLTRHLKLLFDLVPPGLKDPRQTLAEPFVHVRELKGQVPDGAPPNTPGLSLDLDNAVQELEDLAEGIAPITQDRGEDPLPVDLGRPARTAYPSSSLLLK